MVMLSMHCLPLGCKGKMIPPRLHGFVYFKMLGRFKLWCWVALHYSHAILFGTVELSPIFCWGFTRRTIFNISTSLVPQMHLFLNSSPQSGCIQIHPWAALPQQLSTPRLLPPAVTIVVVYPITGFLTTPLYHCLAADFFTDIFYNKGPNRISICHWYFF